MKPTKITLTIIHSSHPEFRYFGSMHVSGRQISKQTQTAEEMEAWKDTAREVAKSWGYQLNVVDETGEVLR
jgi:hypothetical protein